MRNSRLLRLRYIFAALIVLFSLGGALILPFGATPSLADSPPASSGTGSSASGTTAASGGGTGTNTGQLVDVAPSANISVSVIGPQDDQYSQLESKYSMVSLVGSAQWRGFCQQLGRNILITLPKAETISSVSINMEQDPALGVFYPSYVNFEVNLYGSWYTVDQVQPTIPPWNNAVSMQTITGNLKNLQVSQIMISFPVYGWVFANQIHVWSNPTAQPTVLPASQLTATASLPDKPMTTAMARDHGIRNMLLVYTGQKIAADTWTEHDFLPMTGYLSKGRITGRMFDTMLFLPGVLPSKQTDWQAYLNNLFSAKTQLGALNSAVAATNAALAKKDPAAAKFKEKVVIAIPHPNFGVGVWGTLNGQPVSFNGSANDVNAVRPRVQALVWYIQQIVDMWQKAHYSHLQLAGLYWNDEEVDFRTPDDENIIQSAASISQYSYNLPLFWVPYYDAPGLLEWQSNKFTAAWLQPLYIVQGNIDPLRLPAAIQLAQTLGMGFELAIPWEVVDLPSYRNLYLNMLSTLESNGMAGNVSHAYYAGSQVLVGAAYSRNAAQRNVYDATYQFMNSDYSPPS